MTENDIDEFFELLDATFDVLGKTPAAKIISPTAKTLFFRALEQYPIEMVREAFAAHIREGTFTPVPNDISKQIERRMPVQWITADEAFARMPLTEGEPGILNQVTAQALAVAMPFLSQKRPDMNAARMAFRGCYERLVEVEKLAHRTPVHFVSPGGTREAQQALAMEGVRMGLLPLSAAPKAAEVYALPSPQAKAQLRQIKLMMSGARAMPKPEEKDYE